MNRVRPAPRACHGPRAILVVAMLAAVAPAFAQAHDHAGMSHGAADATRPTDHGASGHPAESTTAGPQMDHSQMDHSQTDHAQTVQPQTDHSRTDHSQMDHSQMDHSQMDHSQSVQPQTDHSQMDQPQMDHSPADHSRMDHSRTAAPQVDHSRMDHGTMPRGAATGAPREPIPVPTDADRRAAFRPLSAHPAHGDGIHHYVLLERLETSDARGDGTPLAWDAEAWIGTDLDRLWLRSEGARRGGRTGSASLELLYGRSVTAAWDVVGGIRHEFLPHDARSWAALGIQGEAWAGLEVQATAYLGEGGRSAARVEVEYDVRLSNRLILQPVVEASAFGKDDAGRGVGAGLSTVEAGLRLRYEIVRRFAPYVGIVRERAYGDTADMRHASGEHADETRVVAGVRVWF